MKKGTLKSVVAVALAGVLAAGICCTGYVSRNDEGKWFKNGDISSWHWKDKAGDEKELDPQQTATHITKSAYVEDGEEYGVSLMSSSMDVVSAEAGHIVKTVYVLTATVTPANADDQKLLWTATWENAESEWAAGKEVSDYLNLSVSDNTHVVHVSAIKPYGEKIIVTATSHEDETKFASKKFGFVKQVESLYMKGAAATADTIDFTTSTNMYDVMVNYNLTDGTVTPTVEFTSVTVRFTTDKGSLAAIRKDWVYTNLISLGDSKVCYLSFTQYTWNELFTREVSVSELKAYINEIKGEAIPLMIAASLTVTSDKLEQPRYTSVSVNKNVSGNGLIINVDNVELDGDEEVYL